MSWDVNAFDGIEQALAFIVFGTALVTTVSTMVISMVARRFGRRGSLPLELVLTICAEVAALVVWLVWEGTATAYDVMWGCGLSVLGVLVARKLWTKGPSSN